jgi:hypothetical protein
MLWLVLKDIPCWAKIIEQNKRVATKKRKALKTTKVSKEYVNNVNFVENSKDFKVAMWSQGSHVVKNDQRIMKLKKSTNRSHKL